MASRFDQDRRPNQVRTDCSANAINQNGPTRLDENGGVAQHFEQGDLETRETRSRDVATRHEPYSVNGLNGVWNSEGVDGRNLCGHPPCARCRKASGADTATTYDFMGEFVDLGPGHAVSRRHAAIVKTSSNRHQFTSPCSARRGLTRSLRTAREVGNAHERAWRGVADSRRGSEAHVT